MPLLLKVRPLWEPTSGSETTAGCESQAGTRSNFRGVILAEGRRQAYHKEITKKLKDQETFGGIRCKRFNRWKKKPSH